MIHTPVKPDLSAIPEQFHPYFTNSNVFDSSSSRAARVFYLDHGPGYYLKTAPKGTLKKEAEMTVFFHQKALATEVLAYESLENDWMLTLKADGEDCIDPRYLSEPIRLCDKTAEILRQLHELSPAGCPFHHTADYLSTARNNYRNKAYHPSHFPSRWGYDTPEEAWRVVEENAKYLRSDTLLHGDYCLPNIMLNNWNFSALIDLDAAGLGDRHVDLFWGIWSLGFNLKTDQYRDRFLDAYGRDVVNEEMFPIISAIEVFC